MFNRRQTDHELLRACIQGNAQAFEVLVNKYQSLVCAITYSGTGRIDTSEELAQETFLLAWRNMRQLQDFGKFQAWLCRIARSTVQNWFRKRKRDIASSAVPLEQAAKQASAESEPEQVMVQKEQEEVVNQAISHIPDKYREPLVLFYREERSTREVAERLGLSEDNTRQRIARARNMLREKVETIVETTLMRSRPGKAFTGMVMASIAGIAIKGTVATAVVGQASGQAGLGLSTVFAGMAGKVAMVAAGVAVIVGGALLHRQSGEEAIGLPETPGPIQADLAQGASVNSRVAGPAQRVPDAVDLAVGNPTPATTDTQEQSPVPEKAVQGAPKAGSETELQAAPILRGTLTDIDTGQPITEAQVEIAPSGGGRVYRAEVDQHGVYEFQTVHQNGTYSIRPKPDEYITRAGWERPRETVDLHQDKPTTRDFALEKGCKVKIKAVNESGQPVKRVNFHAVYVSDDVGRGPKDTVRTDANGSVFIGGLRPDEYLIVGAHRDYALVGQKVKFEQAQEVKSITFSMEKGIEVSGLAICSDDLPASGWEIRPKPIWWHSSHSWPYDDPAAEDGSFLFKHVLPGLHRLEVYIPEDGGSRGIWSTEVNLPPDTEVLNLQIPHPSPHGRVSLSGEVVFFEGNYGGGFWIHGMSTTGHSGGVYLNKGERHFTITDLVPGLYDLYMTIDGKRRDFKNVQVPQDDLLLEVTVAPQTILRAQVIDKATGQAVTSFRIRKRIQDVWRQITDPNGLFELPSRGFDAQQVLVQAEGYSEISSPPIYPDANEPTLIKMELLNALTGRIVNEAGEPITGATISYRYRRSSYEDPEEKVITETDAEGRFSMHVTPGRDNMQWFVFRHPDYARVIKHLTVRGENVSGIQVVMPEGGSVQGHAYDWQGDILQDTSIFFMGENSFSYWKQNRARLGEVITDANGFYRIDHLPAEMCYAFLKDPDRQLGVVQSAILPSDKAIRHFNIGGPWRVSGRLMYKGQPRANTRLMVNFNEGVAQGFKARTITNANGQFRFYGLPTGTRSLYCAVRGSRGLDAWIRLGTPSFVEGLDQDLGDFELTLAQVRVDLDVEDTTKSSDHWEVFIMTYDDMSLWRGRRVGQLMPRTVIGDPFVFANLPAGEFEAVATCKNHPSMRQRFTVKPEQEHQSLTMTVPAGSATLSGRIISDDLQTSLSSLLLRNPDQTLFQKMAVDDQGFFHLENLPPGHFIIGKASVAKSRSSVVFEVDLEPGEHKAVQIPVDLHGSGHGYDGYLIVSLVTEQGIPLATSDIWLEQRGRIIEPHFNTDDSKSFMGELGTYMLNARYPGFKPVQTPIEMLSRHDRSTQLFYRPTVITIERQ